jgi:tripartite-type tricarboxylate transporter receptor subunit TctC
MRTLHIATGRCTLSPSGLAPSTHTGPAADRPSAGWLRRIAARSLGILAILGLGWGCLPTQAETYPAKPIRLVVPFGAGSTADILARVLSVGMSEDLGQPLIIDNRPGAGGTIGAAEVARAPADGYTIVLGTVASHVTGVIMMGRVPFDPVRDFQAVTLVTSAPNIIVVNRAVPVSSLAELIDYGKKAGTLNFVSAGPGTTAHLAGEQLRLLTGVPLVHIPYKAVGSAISDLISGQVQVMVYQVPALRPYVDSGAIRALAAASARRIQVMPDLPTVAEVLKTDFDFSAWFGIMAPAATPRPVIDRLHQAVLKAMARPEFKQQQSAQGLEPVGMEPDAFQALMREDLPRWRALIEKSGVKTD